MEKKITCSICEHEEKSFCTVKKIGIAPNKRRRCEKFDFAPLKVKPKQALKTVRMTWEEKEYLRKQYKAELKKVRQLQKEGKLNQVPPTVDQKHPLTGDLSRFVSTVED